LLRLVEPSGDPAHLRVLPPSVGVGAHLPLQISGIEPCQSRCARAITASVEPVTGEACIGRASPGTAQGDQLSCCRKPAIGCVIDVGASRRHRQRYGSSCPFPDAQVRHLRDTGSQPFGFQRQSRGPLRSLDAFILALSMLLAACKPPPEERHPMAEASAERGRAVIARVGCASCHTVPGIRWPEGQVGPSLHGFAASNLISGRLPNRPDVLAAYVADAPAVLPGTTMPAMPISEREARDVAAYLYTLEP
jgi:mono/diheme cytochrome c family protein